MSFCEKQRVRGYVASALLDSIPMHCHFDYCGWSELAAARAPGAMGLDREGFQP